MYDITFPEHKYKAIDQDVMALSTKDNVFDVLSKRYREKREFDCFDFYDLMSRLAPSLNSGRKRHPCVAKDSS